MEDKFADYELTLEGYRKENRLRQIPADRDSAERIDLSGNDYLGLARRSGEFISDFLLHCDASFSSSASRLLASRQRHFLRLETLLEELYGRPAIIFNSGYHANVGAVSALAIPGTLILSDKLIHASIIDGIRLSKTDFARWNHNDTNHLRRLLEKNRGKYRRIIVIAESIYSMDGDVAPLVDLVALKKEFPQMMIYLDEAHGFGVRGERGLGLAEELKLIDEIDILVGTFGKACASEGAFVITSPLLRSFLINTARPLIFSTAIPPVNALWTTEMIHKITAMRSERKKLMEISKDFRNFISRITGSENPSRSQIVPLLIGDAEKALAVASRLDREGIDALAIRRPTVPPGGERIRFSLNASLSETELKRVKKVIEEIWKDEYHLS